MAILDADGKEVKVMPKWHRDINPRSLMQWGGNWFTFYGIDTDHDPDVVMFKWKEPTKSNKKRRNNAT